MKRIFALKEPRLILDSSESLRIMITIFVRIFPLRLSHPEYRIDGF